MTQGGNISSKSAHEPVWSAAPGNLSLADEVHVWRASIDLSPGQRDGFARTLSHDEQARAERFRFQKDRDRFIASHGLLRLILGRYLMTGPEELVFCYNQHGKPSLTIDGNALRFSFNMSHSHDLTLIAVTAGRNIGIDLEFVRADFPSDEIIRQFFPSVKLRSYDTLSEHDRQISFFRWWVRNEACLKAIGQGLSADLRHDFDIPLIPFAPDLQIRTMKSRSGSGQYSLSDLNAGDGYAAALAVQGEHRQHRYWQWRHLSN